ncbi:hypothetical protein Tco_0127459 [Tanacetum coccineum]
MNSRRKELKDNQKKKKSSSLIEAQHYTDEDWDLIRAKIKANAELSKSVLGSDLQGEDFAKKMVDLVNQRKKHFAKERARAKRIKPMIQSQLRTYMMNYLKNQGTWKLSQLKNLSFEEVKEEFDKLVKQIVSFAPINFEATKDSLKRFGEELQTKTSKRLKNLDKDDSKVSDKASEQDDYASGTKIPINHVPVAMKSPTMLKDISRDDLTELYRIIMNRYGMNGPEDGLEKVLWGYLKNMFEEPLRTDPIWSVCKAMLDKNFKEENQIRIATKTFKWKGKASWQYGWYINSPSFKVLRVDMVINPPWNLPFLGAKGLTSPEQTATGVNTPGSDENSLKLYDLIADMKGC